MSRKNIFTVSASIALTIASGTALAILVAVGSSGFYAAGTVLLLGILLYAQLTLARYHSAQIRRTQRYHQLGRKLVHIKRIKKRDETVALKVLNHIVNQSDQDCAHAKIWQRPLADFSGDLAIARESEKGGKTYTIMADLTGHGIAAAMGATPVASIFQATARRGLSVDQIIVELNERLSQLLPSGFFCCAAIVVCDGKQLTVCNAGLPEMIVADNQGRIIDRIESTQLPLGIQKLESADVQIFTKTYHDQHQLYAFTDGLIEARAANDDVFDSTMLETLIAENTGSVSRIPLIKQSYEDFVKGSKQCDDISIVEVNIC